MEYRTLAVIVVILVVGLVIGSSLTGFVSGPPAGGEWMCIQNDPTICTKYISADEWKNQNCMQVDEQTNCQVFLENGQTAIVPLADLEISDEVCIEWACAVEVWGRSLV